MCRVMNCSVCMWGGGWTWVKARLCSDRGEAGDREAVS